MALGFGVFVALPWVVAALMYAYEDIFGGIIPTAAPRPIGVGPSGTIVMPKAPPKTSGSGIGSWPLAARIGVAALILAVGVLFAVWSSHPNSRIRHLFSHHVSDRMPEADSVGSVDNNGNGPSPSTSSEVLDPSSREALNDRLDAASNISVPSEKDESLATLASDAAKAGEVEIVNQSLGQMSNPTRQDGATHDAAGLLAKRGLRKPAIDLAKRISNNTLRDRALAELAQ
jgi:hypothetical protein